MSRPGDRVYAVIGQHLGAVEVLGAGEYIGDRDMLHPPEGVPVPIGWVADVIVELGWERLLNPLIRLDSGGYVWGCECWFGDEERVRESLAGRDVREVDIDSVRAAAKEES
jgi:hypothetical protein